MYRYCLLFFILFLLILSPRGQNNKSKLQYEELYRNAERLYTLESATETTDSIAIATYQKVIDILSKEKNYGEKLVDSYLKCGILKMTKNEREQALDFFHGALAISRLGKHLPDSLMFKPCLYIGSIHYDLNNLDSAAYYYDRAEAINNQYGGLDESERLYNKFGALYYEIGDYKKSINYFKKALSIVAENRPMDIFFIVNYKNNIAAALLKLQEYKQALKILTSLVPFHIAGDELFYNIGNACIAEGEFKEATKYLGHIQNMDHEKYNSIANAFIHLKSYDSAQAYLIRAKNVYLTKKEFSKKIDYGITLKYSGDQKVAIGKTFEAISDYQLAITQLDPGFSDTSIISNPSVFLGLQNFSLLFDALIAKASALQALNTQQANRFYLEQSLKAYTSALLLAKHMERIYFSDEARLFLKNKVNPATQHAVATAIQLYNQSKGRQFLQLAFQFAESNKASVLQAGLQNIQLQSIPGISTVMLAEERKYKSLIAKLGIQLAQVKDSSTFSAIQKKIEESELALSILQEKLDQSQAYHKLRFNSRMVSIDSLQHNLIEKDEAILSYYYTGDNLLCFYITDKEAGLSSVPLANNFSSSILSLRKALETPESSNRKFLRDAGFALYEELIFPVSAKIKDKHRLVIIPYNEIAYIPFEILADRRDGSLLLNKFSISYNYSANFILDKKADGETDYKVLAMAPFSEKENIGMALPLLPSSAEEINDLPGKKFVGTDATKSQFIEQSALFPVIHLATHAIVNDTNTSGSYIEFYGLKSDADTAHRLYEQEIYNLDMKSARLVILSACETGNGLLVNGEGIISLSRAFSYAGCKSVITSLWKADDIATTFIIKRLHYYLQKGWTKDISLQKAKIDYLNNTDIDDRFKSPPYWAHLVLIGDSGPLVVSEFQWYLPVLIFIILGLTTFLFFRKRNQA